MDSGFPELRSGPRNDAENSREPRRNLDGSGHTTLYGRVALQLEGTILSILTLSPRPARLGDFD